MLTILARAILAVSRSRSAVADLIAEDPEGWTVGQYEAEHRQTGVIVWIANEEYGIRVKGGGLRDDWKPSKPEKRLIWSAYKQHLRHRRMTEVRRLETLIRQHLDGREPRP